MGKRLTFMGAVMKKPIPVATLIISCMTLIVSSYVATEVAGSPFSKVRVLDLRDYGGVTFDHLRNFEIWRLLTANLVHVQPIHMLYNVISLIALGLYVERFIGTINFFLLWFLSGSTGMLIGMLFIAAPYDVGTGASQAVIGIAACGVLLVKRRYATSFLLKAILLFTLLPAFALDFYVVHYPKPGHVVPLLVGWLLSLYMVPRKRNEVRRQPGEIDPPTTGNNRVSVD